MSGTTIPLFTKRSFDITSGTQIVIRSLDVSQWTEGVIQVRVHENAISSGSVVVTAHPIANTPEDPSVDFVDDTAVGTATVGTSVASPAGALERGALGSGFGSALQIRVTGSSADAAPVLSAELVMKD